MDLKPEIGSCQQITDGFDQHMDSLDWVARGAGLIFCLLVLWRGFRMILPARVRETPLWMQWMTLGSGALWAALLAFDWAFPVAVNLYVTNGSAANYNITVGDRAFCLPGGSFAHLTWRLSAPTEVIAQDASGPLKIRYTVSKGTWFVNVSPVPVSADTVNRENAVANWNGFGVPRQGSLRFSIRGATPYRLFSESSVDRLETTSEKMQERSLDAPCTKTP